MFQPRLVLVILVGSLLPISHARLVASTAQSSLKAWKDPSPHKIKLVHVDQNVQLQVLDWGGIGRNVILLAGLGNTAHVFDDFAPKLAKHFHVYGITRRGFGHSSLPKVGYDAKRLGDDVVAVLDALNIKAPVLVGHSIAGEELSSITTYHPGRVAGLVYLEAGYSYALYSKEHGDYIMDMRDLIQSLTKLDGAPFDASEISAVEKKLTSFKINLAEIRDEVAGSNGPAPAPADMANFPAMQTYMAKYFGGLEPESELHELYQESLTAGVGKRERDGSAQHAIMLGEEKYTTLPGRILAIFAYPNSPEPDGSSDLKKRAAAKASEKQRKEAQIKAFETYVPQAQVVALANHTHYLFLSDQAEVLQLVTNFVNGLPTANKP